MGEAWYGINYSCKNVYDTGHRLLNNDLFDTFTNYNKTLKVKCYKSFTTVMTYPGVNVIKLISL